MSIVVVVMTVVAMVVEVGGIFVMVDDTPDVVLLLLNVVGCDVVIGELPVELVDAPAVVLLTGEEVTVGLEVVVLCCEVDCIVVLVIGDVVTFSVEEVSVGLTVVDFTVLLVVDGVVTFSVEEVAVGWRVVVLCCKVDLTVVLIVDCVVTFSVVVDCCTVRAIKVNKNNLSIIVNVHIRTTEE